MRNLKKVIKATILDLIVALLFMTVIIGNIYLFAGQRIGLVFGLINKFKGVWDLKVLSSCSI